MSEFTFEEFPKIARLNRPCVISEKIDGTNGQIIVSDGRIQAASRSCLIFPDRDNHGFAAWVRDHESDLIKLGPGRHFGEWWGSGIQRKYGLTGSDKRFSLFNSFRWSAMDARPPCCGIVPILYQGPFSTSAVNDCVAKLRESGSVAAPGFMKPEGVVVWHVAAQIGFKVTLEKDEEPKGKSALDRVNQREVVDA
jgi:RNA ligase-like protein